MCKLLQAEVVQLKQQLKDMHRKSKEQSMALLELQTQKASCLQQPVLSAAPTASGLPASARRLQAEKQLPSKISTPGHPSGVHFHSDLPSVKLAPYVLSMQPSSC